jgi:hypothetical protein
MSALPVSAESKVYFGDVETLENGTKIVSLMVKDVSNLGGCEVFINVSEGVNVINVTSGDGDNAFPIVDSGDIDTDNIMTITAYDASTSYSGEVIICNIAYEYEGSDPTPISIDSTDLVDYSTYKSIQHTGNNIVRSSGTSTVKPTATKVADDSATSVATVSEGDAGGDGIVAESTEIVDENNGSSGEDNNGIPGFELLTGLSVMLIAVRLLRENK